MSPSDEIVPFQLEIAQAELDQLRRRISETRWPDQPAGSGWSLGPPVDYLRELAEYWRDTYDWRAAETRINSFEGFRTEIDGATVHFLHVRSASLDAVPLILTHGWPGSIVEYLDVIEQLTDPERHGGSAADAFHLVIPSIPGFGLSGPTPETGWTVRRVAQAWAELMHRLGYPRYLAHGNDWGSAITRELGLVAPGHVTALHVLQLFGSTVNSHTGDPNVDEERDAIAAGRRYRTELGGYAALQSTRPQLIGYALTDSPVGQLAWIVDGFRNWTDARELPEDAVARDAMLTNIMLYWLTGTAGSSARFYWDNRDLWDNPPEPSSVPTAVAVFPGDIVRPIRRVAEQTNNIVRWTVFDRGGHFGPLEEPDLVVADLRAAFRDYRT